MWVELTALNHQTKKTTRDLQCMLQVKRAIFILILNAYEDGEIQLLILLDEIRFTLSKTVGLNSWDVLLINFYWLHN